VTDLFTRLKDALADRYRIERELGHGGMATVYLAMDLRHDRNVAVKVLRPELAAVIGAERFLAEIKTTAALQHPHILPLFDSGEVAGQLFYVMPLIEGESLRDRLVREKQLPIADAVRIATEVAGALDYAHRRGVIHRDIKPENILLHDGRALVADFGIALAASKAGSTRMTETGMSLGTPHYMAPEQAMGEREITAKADIYALGCVTYEMLTAEPPFQGATAQAIIARVMTETPRALTLQRHTIPPHVEDAVLTAIEKLPADRFATAAEFAGALAGDTSATRQRTGTLLRPGTGAGASRRTVTMLGAGLALTAVIALWGWLRPHASFERAVRRYAVELSGDGALTASEIGVMALSPDGTRMAYLGRSASGEEQIWIRDRNQLHARPLSGTTHAGSLAFSPDGRQVTFIGRDPAGLKTVSLEGGTPTTVSDSLSSSGGTAWGRDGFLYTSGGFNGKRGIVRVPVNGGTVEEITMVDTSTHALAHIYPVLLPGSRGLLYAIFYGPTRITESDIAVVDLKTHISRVLARGVRARYLPSGQVLVVRTDGSMVALPFDEKRLAITGAAVPILAGVEIVGGYLAEFDISETGDLAYYAGEPRNIREPVQPVWVTRTGASSPIDSAWHFGRPFNGGLALSPDGRQLALAIAGDNTADIWIKQLDHGPLSRLTFEEFLKYRPTWSPDGRAVTYIADPGNNNAVVYRKRADGSGAPERLYGNDHSIAEALWSHDGKWLVLRNTLPSRDLVAMRPGVDSTPVPIVASPKFEERAATLSPDGRFIAYQSDETGKDEIYVRPFPRADDGRWQLSTSGGSEPLWSRSGREIFFRTPSGELMSTPVTTTPSFSPGTPKVLFSTKGFARAAAYRAYDVTPDDQRFVMLRALDDSAVQQSSQLVFVDNWLAELQDKLQHK
jgi:Tol biopolymer transport system component